MADQQQAPPPPRTTYRHEDDRFIDRVEVDTVPRYKTSGLSGDEWRTSAVIRLFRKGHLVHEEHMQNLEVAAARLPWLMRTVLEDLPIEQYTKLDRATSSLCAQVSCGAPAEVYYRLRELYCREGHGHAPYEGSSYIRGFCLEHARRGDCGLEDADANYQPADEQSLAICKKHGLLTAPAGADAGGITVDVAD